MVWTEKQELRLIELYELHKEILEGSSKAADANRRKQAKWTSITNEINAAFEGSFTMKATKKKYQNIKSALREKLSANRRSQQKTGGGDHKEISLSLAEQELDRILGSSRGFIGEPQYIKSSLVDGTSPSGTSNNSGPKDDKETEKHSLTSPHDYLSLEVTVPNSKTVVSGPANEEASALNSQSVASGPANTEVHLL